MVVFVWRNKLVNLMDTKWIKSLVVFLEIGEKTHNQGVFDAYTPEMRAARKSGVITGLPDAYGRGRIIGDYRRVALYGVDHLIEAKKADLNLTGGVMSEDTMRLREELSEQIRALQELKQMAASHGFDISKPATTAQEAFQWLYFAYLAAIKEQKRSCNESWTYFYILRYLY